MRFSFDGVAKVYDAMNDYLSLGLHRSWKWSLVRESISAAQPDGPLRVLDLATGTGDVAGRFASSSNIYSIHAIDPSVEMLHIARSRWGDDIRWMPGRAEHLICDEESFDLVSCAFGVRNFSDRTESYSRVRRVLKKGGVFAVLEIHPLKTGPLSNILSGYWDVLMPRLGKWIGNREAYVYLRDSSRTFMSRESLVEEVCAFGFELIHSRSLFCRGMVGLSLFRKVEQ